MTTLSSSSSSSCHRSTCIEATLHAPRLDSLRVSFPKIPTGNLFGELNLRKQDMTATTSGRNFEENSNSLATAKLYALLETVSDRIEMHANIGEQRNNWNTLLLTSINALTISAATMAGLAAIAGSGTPTMALKLSSTLLYSAATGMSLVMNNIQPSQLAEEQRNAVRLFKQLRVEIETMLAIGSPTSVDVKNTMKKVLALDKAYPLPLLGGVMLDKFPQTVEPAVWWPQQERLGPHSPGKAGDNGWSAKLENEMRRISAVLERKDEKEYVRLSKMILNVNKVLAISGPLLTGLAAIGSTLVGAPSHGSWAGALAIVCGALASVVNTLEHGGQVGMVFEMYRSCAGSFQLLQDSIDSTLEEKNTAVRENGQVFEMKVALQLGRSLSQLRDLATTSKVQEFGSKLL